MLVALLLAHGAALSAPRAALSTHRAQRTALSAKKRDYMSGGLGSSKQEKFAQLWRNRNDPEAEAESVIAPEDVERVQTTTTDKSLAPTLRSLDQDHTQVVAFIDQENS